MCNTQPDDSNAGMWQKLGWCSLQQRRTDICLVFLLICMNGLVAVDLSDQLARQTRPSHHCKYMANYVTVETKTSTQTSLLPCTKHQWKTTCMLQPVSLDTLASHISYPILCISLLFSFCTLLTTCTPLSYLLFLFYSLFFSVLML